MFNFDIVNSLLKIYGGGGGDRRPNFINFVIWSAIFVGWWVVVVWSRKSYLRMAEFAFFVFYSRMGDEG